MFKNEWLVSPSTFMEGVDYLSNDSAFVQEPASMNAQEIIDRLNLLPLPHEGGYFTEVYQDPDNRSQSSIY